MLMVRINCLNWLELVLHLPFIAIGKSVIYIIQPPEIRYIDVAP